MRHAFAGQTSPVNRLLVLLDVLLSWAKLFNKVNDPVPLHGKMGHHKTGATQAGQATCTKLFLAYQAAGAGVSRCPTFLPLIKSHNVSDNSEIIAGTATKMINNVSLFA